MKPATPDDIAMILDEFVDLSKATVRRESLFGEDLPIDSQDMLRFMERVKRQYPVQFSLEDIIRIRTVGDLCDAINRLAART